MEVLDTLLFIVNRRIESKVYFKPTDGHVYLFPQSSHHQSLYRNISFGVELRPRRICGRDDWLEEQLQEFKHFFQCRRYNNNIINEGFKRAKNIARSDALLPKPSTIDSLQNLVLVMDYHPNFRDIPKLIRDDLSILCESPRMKKVFSNDKTCIKTGFSRTKTFKYLLVPSALPDLNRTDNLNSDVVRCFRCDCKVCDACHNFLLP